MDAPPLRIGLDAYWRQLAGLEQRLRVYLARVERKPGRPGVEVVNAGLVDNPDRAFAAGREFRRHDIDVIFLHVTTYALSSTVLPVVMRAKVPVTVLNLAPEPTIDYAAFNAMGDRTAMTGEWLAHCACGARDFVTRWNSHGPAHHCAVGVGHLAGTVEKLGALLGLHVARVC